VLSLGGFPFFVARSASRPWRETAKQLLSDLPVFGGHQILALSDAIRSQNLLAQLAKPTESPAIAGSAIPLPSRPFGPAIQDFRCRSKHDVAG
jgi:hypothetical protein